MSEKKAFEQLKHEPGTQHGSWIGRWYGSPPFEGYSICCGDECIAHLGTEISGDEVRKIVNAHNLCKIATKQEQEPVDYLIKAYKLAKELSDHLSVGPAKPQRKPLTDEVKNVINAARAAMDESAEANDGEGSILISSELAASLSLCLDEYDRSIEAANSKGDA